MLCKANFESEFISAFSRVTKVSRSQDSIPGARGFISVSQVSKGIKKVESIRLAPTLIVNDEVSEQPKTELVFTKRTSSKAVFW